MDLHQPYSLHTDTDPNTGKNRSSPIFRYSSEFRYLGFRYSSRYLYYDAVPSSNHSTYLLLIDGGWLNEWIR